MSEAAVFLMVLVLLIAGQSRIAQSRFWAWCALSLIVAAGIAHQLAFDVMAEDAYISFRYARNLADGAGLVFNPGERVEGYSNFLLTILLAAFYRWFAWDIPQTARLFGIVCNSLSIVLVYSIGCRLTGDRRAGIAAAVLLAGCGSVMAFGPSGLETPLFTTLVCAVIAFAAGGRWALASLGVALATMTRPDGCLLAVPCLIQILGETAKPGRLRTLGPFLAPVIGLLLPWTIWRVWYYGQLLPNTIIAKRGMDLAYQLASGAAYVGHFVIAALPLFILFGIALFTAVRQDALRWLKGTLLFLAIWASLLLLFVAVIGGDWMPGWRFAAPALPAICLITAALWWRYLPSADFAVRRRLVFEVFAAALLVACVALLAARSPRDWLPALDLRIVLVACLAIAILAAVWCTDMTQLGREERQPRLLGGFIVTAGLLFGASWLHPNLIPHFRYWQQQTKGLADIGRWFGETLPPGTPVAAFAAGALSYYDGLPTIDVLGLTDEHIARFGKREKTGWPGHIAHDYAYVASRLPQIVFLSGQGFQDRPASGPPPPDFTAAYQAISFRLAGRRNALGQYANLLVLRTQAEALTRALLSGEDVSLAIPADSVPQ